MKKILLLLLLTVSTISFSQKTCGYDAHQARLESQFPEIKKSREEAEAKLLSMDIKSYLNKIGATSKNNLYTGTIYEIPVVIHVIESSDPSNSGLHLTDTQIQNWINNTNKMYATTYGNGFPAEGTGSLDGTVIPFKLVLAKRTPQCTASNGIVRYNGSTLSGYDQYGVYNSSTGVTTAQIKTIAPHWPESSYFNIYVVIGFDGDKSTYGLMGWCGFPSNPDSSYESFMKVTVVTNVDDSTLAHEFGHGMALDHPFKGASSNPTNNPPLASDCPTNNDCTTDNDKVCDTEPTASLLSVYPTPTNSVINPCTGTNYNGVQYNIMNYTYDANKFTPGQRDRAIAMFMLYRANLTTSTGGKDLVTNPSPGALTAASCTPAGITTSGNYNMGPTNVTLGSINNTSSGYMTSNAQYYVDYSAQNCTNPTVYTDLQVNTPQTIKVSFVLNPQTIKVWIDYNNNGTFESTELVATGNSVSPSSSPFTASFTPPVTAVQNTYLRMRVRCDYGSYDSCQNLAYGQIEDYSVRIINGTLGTDNSSVQIKDAVVYNKENNKLTLLENQKEGFGAYVIYDVNGKVIQRGNTKSNEITINKSITFGMYILSYKNGTETKKFLK